MKILQRVLVYAAIITVVSAMGQRPGEREFLTAEEFFGENLVLQIEELGIPFSTYGSLMSVMHDAPPSSRPERVMDGLEFDLCTLPRNLTLRFFWREYVPNAIPSRQQRGSFAEMTALHDLEGPCESENVIGLLQEYSFEENERLQHDPDGTIEMVIEDFHARSSWRSTYYLVLERNISGALTTADIREEWRVITPWGYFIQQLQQNPQPSQGERWLGRFSFPLQLGYWYDH